MVSLLVIGAALLGSPAHAQAALDGVDGWGGTSWGGSPEGAVKAVWDKEVRLPKYAENGLHTVQLRTQEQVTLGGAPVTLTERTFWLGGLAAVQFSVPSAHASTVVSALTSGAGDSVAQSGARLWSGARTYLQVRDTPTGVTVTLASLEARAACARWVGRSCALPISPEGVKGRAAAQDAAQQKALKAAECLRGGAENYSACMAR